MGNRFSKRPRDNDASSPTISKKQRYEQSEQCESESPHLLPSSDSLEKIDLPSASGSNSDPYASSTSVNGNNYYVFLSFRGPDTRKGFVDHLYQRLKDVGLRCHTNPVFRDDEDLPFGEKIGENLISAIEHSKVSIPVISENYAASEWCLRELIHIMECKESREQIVLPVLYKVKPKDVRHLGGSFGEAFRIHEHRFDEKVKQQGPTALKKALDLKVFESEKFADGFEGELVKELVEIIVHKQQRDFQPHLPINLVGIEDCVAEVMELVDLACPDTRIIGIWGMGGIGRAIARPADKKPWDCSRLWDEEAMIVLRREGENEKIEALHLDERGSREFMERKSFKKMPNLKFLHLNVVGFAGDFEGSLSELRWLKWEDCPNSFEATGVHLEKLVTLDLSNNDISENWRGWSSIKMERLKVLNLSQCHELTSTPNFSMFKNLEVLNMEFCIFLKKIDPSIGDVKSLISLNLRRCLSLEKLPEQLGELENLEELVISESGIITEIPPCIGSLKKLKRLSASWDCRPTDKILQYIPEFSSFLELVDAFPIPSSIGKLGELVELDLSCTEIKELPESIGGMSKLKILKIYRSRIERLPSSIGKLQSLEELDAWDCFDLEGEIHVDEGGLSSLKTLRLGRTKISGLPENLDQLSSLEHLDLEGCRELESLPKPPFSLSFLKLTCRSNELPSLSHLKHLKELKLSSCKSLQSIPELPSCIRTIDVFECPKLERLPNLFDLEFLSKLLFKDCNRLKQLDGLEALKSLRELNLSRISFNEADNLHAIRGLEKLGSLERLSISNHDHIQVLDLSKSEHLKQLNVSNCKSLVEIRCPSKFLKYFGRYGCESLKKLPDFLPPNM